MPKKTKVFLLFSAFLLSMCSSYANAPITYVNGLSCRNYSNSRFFQRDENDTLRFYVQEEGANCSYTCPDGSHKETRISGSISSVYAFSKEELNAEFCGIALPPTPAPPTASPTSGAAETPTATASPTTSTASPTVTLTLAPGDPLLAETVSMCDLGGKLINFRIVQPAPEIDEEALQVEVAGKETTCYVNRTNPSLLTCSIPNEVSFPASVVVRLNGLILNDFEYSGLGCSVLTTPTPAPRSYP